MDLNRKDANRVHKLEESSSLSSKIWKAMGDDKRPQTVGSSWEACYMHRTWEGAGASREC